MFMPNLPYTIMVAPKPRRPDPDPDCRWCKGTGKVTLATSIKPCLDCLAPFEGWVWPNFEDRDSPTVFYTDIDGREVEVSFVCKAGAKSSRAEAICAGAICVGRLCRYSRPGRDSRKWFATNSNSRKNDGNAQAA